ncbi:hypothetical protein, partial [Paraburkholderia fungorum]|uniref:hypothetical protein n=1 Tax=Paraburkholderia fungorum TaxID=134537 RepID=UPI00248DEDE7
HRGNANRPLTIQGKAKRPKDQNQNKPRKQQTNPKTQTNNQTAKPPNSQKPANQPQPTPFPAHKDPLLCRRQLRRSATF